MKIPAAKLDSFVKSPDKGINFVLIYGPDAGLVSERVKTISKTAVDDLSDPFRVAELSFDTIKDDPSIFADEINAISMIGGRRLIKIRTESATFPKELAEIIKTSNTDSLVVFSGGDLAATSAIRKFFEDAKNAAAIPCYKDDTSAIQQLITQKLSSEGYNFDSDVVRYLAGSFSGDRLVILNEVEKLMLYMGDKKQISLDDVKYCVYDSSEFSLDDLCNSFASRNPYDTEKNINKALNDGVAAIAIIRSMLRYFMRLQEVKNKIAEGMDEQQAVSSLRPPVFFKQLPLFKKHLSLWKNNDINRAIAKLIELEIDCKTTGNPADLLCARLLIMLPLMVK